MAQPHQHGKLFALGSLRLCRLWPAHSVTRADAGNFCKRRLHSLRNCPRQTHREGVGPLCHINPSLNIHPHTASSFLEPGHRAQNSDALPVSAMSNDDLRGARLRDDLRINPALNVTAVALKKSVLIMPSIVAPVITDASPPIRRWKLNSGEEAVSNFRRVTPSKLFGHEKGAFTVAMRQTSPLGRSCRSITMVFSGWCYERFSELVVEVADPETAVKLIQTAF
jgi:hypothetical protein